MHLCSGITISCIISLLCIITETYALWSNTSCTSSVYGSWLFDWSKAVIKLELIMRPRNPCRWRYPFMHRPNLHHPFLANVRRLPLPKHKRYFLQPIINNICSSLFLTNLKEESSMIIWDLQTDRSQWGWIWMCFWTEQRLGDHPVNKRYHKREMPGPQHFQGTNIGYTYNRSEFQTWPVDPRVLWFNKTNQSPNFVNLSFVQSWVVTNQTL